MGPLVLDRLRFATTGVERMYPGGNAVIFSSIAARMSASVAILGQVGSDAGGAAIRNRLEAHGVDTTHLRVLSGGHTKVATLRVFADGTWEKETSRPERVPYLENSMDPPGLSNFGHLHVGGFEDLVQASPKPARRLIKLCRGFGLSVSFGLAPSRPHRPLFEDLVAPEEDLVLCNRDELAHYIDRDLCRPDEVVEAMRAAPFRYCVVTLGPQGAVARWGPDRVFSVPTGARRALSTVGAGDVLAAAFVTSLQAGFDVKSSLERACEAASSSVEAETWDGWLPSRDERRSFHELAPGST